MVDVNHFLPGLVWVENVPTRAKYLFNLPSGGKGKEAGKGRMYEPGELCHQSELSRKHRTGAIYTCLYSTAMHQLTSESASTPAEREDTPRFCLRSVERLRTWESLHPNVWAQSSTSPWLQLIKLMRTTSHKVCYHNSLVICQIIIKKMNLPPWRHFECPGRDH